MSPDVAVCVIVYRDGHVRQRLEIQLFDVSIDVGFFASIFSVVAVVFYVDILNGQVCAVGWRFLVTDVVENFSE